MSIDIVIQEKENGKVISNWVTSNGDYDNFRYKAVDAIIKNDLEELECLGFFKCDDYENCGCNHYYVDRDTKVVRAGLLCVYTKDELEDSVGEIVMTNGKESIDLGDGDISEIGELDISNVKLLEKEELSFDEFNELNSVIEMMRNKDEEEGIFVYKCDDKYIHFNAI